MENNKFVIYQIFTRLFGNSTPVCTYNGDITGNGCGKMNDISNKALQEIRKLGTTHIWYTGIIEHATQTDYTSYGIRKDHPAIVKGKAGSPYAIKDYYDIDPDLAVSVPDRMKEFEKLVKRTHDNGMKVIIDFVPNHVARQYHSDQLPDGVAPLGGHDNPDYAFSPYNNFYYIPHTELHGQFDMKAGEAVPYREYPAKATGNDRFDAYPNVTDWYETVKLNYGVDYMNGRNCCFSPNPDTWMKMLKILQFWASKGVDGFRCDMAELVPVEFWEWVIPRVKDDYPEIIFIAEIYNPDQYRNYLFRGKFDYLYDKVGLYDTLRNITCGYDSAAAITPCWQSLDGIQDKMLNFLENHDEQRIASHLFAGNARKALPALVVSTCMNTNPVMIYFGQELGELGMDNEGFSGLDGRTTIFDYWSVDSIRRWRNEGAFDGKLLSEEEKQLQQTYRKILTLCLEEKAISKGLFFDLMYVNYENWKFNSHKQYAFLRKYESELLIVLVNFDLQPVEIAVNLPSHAFDFMKIPQQDTVEAVDLLSGKKENIALLPYKPMETTVGRYGAKILKVHL